MVMTMAMVELIHIICSIYFRWEKNSSDSEPNANGKDKNSNAWKKKEKQKKKVCFILIRWRIFRKILNFPTFMFPFEDQIITSICCILKNFLAARKAEEELKKKEAMAALSTSFGGYKSQGKNDSISEWYLNDFKPNREQTKPIVKRRRRNLLNAENHSILTIFQETKFKKRSTKCTSIFANSKKRGQFCQNQILILWLNLSWSYFRSLAEIAADPAKHEVTIMRTRVNMVMQKLSKKKK